MDNSYTSLFSSSGTLPQIENGMKAAMNGDLALALSSKNGSVICSVKNLPPLIEIEKVKKTFLISKYVCMTYSGLQADFNFIYGEALKIAEDFFYKFKEEINILQFVDQLSRKIQEISQMGGMRPVGIFLLLSGRNKNIANIKRQIVEHEGLSYKLYSKNIEEYETYQVDPAGNYKKLSVAGSGKDYAKAVEFLNKRYDQNITIDDNILNAVQALKEYCGFEIQKENISISIIKDEVKEISLNEISDIFEDLQ